MYRGVEQYPLNGVSMRYSFDSADAPTQKKQQYYTMLGTRGIWKGGWKASALHAPLSGSGKFEQDKWELYHVDEDRSESTDLSREHPQRLKELIDAWFAEAEKNFVLPLDDRSAAELLTLEHPTTEGKRTRFIYFPQTSPVPESVAARIIGRSYKVVADVKLTSDSRGVIFACGSHFGGHTMFIKDRRLHYVYNFLGIEPEQSFVSEEELSPGKHTLGIAFVREKAGEHGESVGTAQLYIDDTVVAEGEMRTQPGHFNLSGDGLCVGYDSEDPVSREYTAPNEFIDGTIYAVAFDVSDEVYLDLEREAATAMARD
jgi:arylsulfatase